MSAIEDNLELERGADYEDTEYITDDFDNPLDISGDTFIATISASCGSAVLATFTFNLVLDTSVTPNIWQYVRSMPRATIDALTITEGYWEQFQISPANKSTKNFKGMIEIACKSTTIPV